MDYRFDEIATKPENEIFKVVFFPDRIYHAQYLNATRSARYRYNVQEVRNAFDVAVLKGEVYLDGIFLTNFIRVEYKGSRLAELAREQGRMLHEDVRCKIKISSSEGPEPAEATITLNYCPFVRAYQAEIWGTLEAPDGNHHDYSVLSQMGYNTTITRVRQFVPALEEVKKIKKVELNFYEYPVELPFDRKVKNPQEDNNFLRSHQEPNSPLPNDYDRNTIKDQNYLLNFQRGWFIDVNEIKPVRYQNAMMDDRNRERVTNDPAANITEMKWIVQRELGASLVFFHEVTVNPGCVEGTHQHIGTEELYYIFQGEGIAYMAVGDDPATDEMIAEFDPATNVNVNKPKYKTVSRDIFGLDPHDCKELEVNPGKVIFTKSGGIHGIRNTGTVPLKFVAFLYHTS